MKILQINTTVGIGSTGRIAENIGLLALKNGMESYVGYGRGKYVSKSSVYKIGSTQDIFFHGLQTIFFDRHGFGSKAATKKFIEFVSKIKPDLIHLHNLHGYYLHIGVLGEFLAEFLGPVVWTFHDSWPYTGHCTFFDNISCERWKTGCYDCPKKGKYPASYFRDRSRKNYESKRDIFNKIKKLTIVSPSLWLANLIKQSFLKGHNLLVIPNGIDVVRFAIKENSFEKLHQYPVKGKVILLGVANVWDPRKGFNDFLELSKIIEDHFLIVLIGLADNQMKELPQNILGIQRTQDIEELSYWYNAASVFINPTWQDNFPTTNLEALACGTPVVTYNTGGSPEAVDFKTGRVVNKGDIVGLKNAIDDLRSISESEMNTQCRNRALELFDMENRCMDYINLYKQLVNQNG